MVGVEEIPRVRLSQLEALADSWVKQGAALEKLTLDQLATEMLGAKRCAEELRLLIATYFEPGMRVTYLADGKRHTGELLFEPVEGSREWEIVCDSGSHDFISVTSIRYLGEG